LWVENVNLSVALVEHGLAKIHFSGENSEFARQLQNAKNTAKAKGVWVCNTFVQVVIYVSFGF
jgi:staphylococcal nuclease domain-containing protein 1